MPTNTVVSACQVTTDGQKRDMVDLGKIKRSSALRVPDDRRTEWVGSPMPTAAHGRECECQDTIVFRFGHG